MTPPKDPPLQLKTAPFLASPVTTPRVMFDVIGALIPVVCGAVYYFGVGALLVIVAAILGCVATELVLNRKGANFGDGTIILTGLLLGLTLPPIFPMWMAFLGGVVAVGLGRLIWGGLGQNIFNPALVGRAFLQAAFPTAITTWRPPADVDGIFDIAKSNLALPFMRGEVDVVTGATPLAKMKFEHQFAPFDDLMTGNVAGSLGETFGILILVGGLYLLWRRAFDWRIPVAILAAVAAFAAVLHGIDPARYPSAQFMIGSGGLLLGAVFMATDPVTSPMAPLGAWIFGIGIGILVVLIRLWGGLPEGVMYAILLMNAATPLIDRYVQPTPFGRKFGGKVAK